MAILFDIDGTLLDQDRAQRAGVVALHRMVGSSSPIDEFMSNWSTALERYFYEYVNGEITYQEQGRARVRQSVDPDISNSAADRIYAIYLDAYEAAWSLYPDVLPCLDRLAGHGLGIISNGLSTEQRRKLAKTGIEGRFDFILISEECKWAKPSREIFRHACVAIGEDPANVIYVGNHYDHDANAARDAGLTGIWLDRHNNASALHSTPILRTLSELPLLPEVIIAA